ncbi:uncharacterized protein E0L32_011874 [Thyridium curvatum]|uniref:CFEM domain-containing protein n=1 Tax=Thyridium curvatum TaxID=1093900 RepID=A0A507B4K3_9PEZI|nr:uncharacterized protein E0L32_011874 [Thyridium curvatum]TPX18055.1 hypothetical protein E0L32_011874 [Thyridium curvatum]
MQLTTLFVAALSAAVATAQCNTSEPPPIPTCAQNCIASAASAIGCTSPTDFACQCKSASQFAPQVTPCLISKCGGEVALSISAVASSMCANCGPPPMPTPAPETVAFRA